MNSAAGLEVPKMSELVTQSHWDFLKAYTDARIAIGRAGHSIPTDELLKFQLAHAQAKDAVYSQLDVATLKQQILNLPLNALELHSKAQNRDEYLKRPDLGRALNDDSYAVIDDWLNGNEKSRKVSETYFELCFCAVDGLSAEAIQNHLIPFMNQFLLLSQNENWSLAPICIVNQGRVAIGDAIANRLKAEIVVVLIGERPGLSSPDSMGIYLTYRPLPGFTDEKRNCISNIRLKGLPYEKAAQALIYLIKASKALKLSGVALKEDRLLES